MIIYFDNCCFNRPFDDLTQDKIRIESDAVCSILKKVENGKIKLLGSDILDAEMLKMKDLYRRSKVLRLYSLVRDKVELTNAIERRAQIFRAETEKYRGKEHVLKLYDSLHLASAEIGEADVFLTVDERVISTCKNLSLNMRVMNPVVWFLEYEGGDLDVGY